MEKVEKGVYENRTQRDYSIFKLQIVQELEQMELLVT
jgi:hypothetical protein